MTTVGVIIATYNGEHHIRETLASVVGQSLRPDEVIVVDDGSTDGTCDAVREFPGVRLLQQPNSREHVARNRGLAHITTDYVTFIDQDDLWHPAHIERMLRAAIQCDEDAVLLPTSVYFTEDASLADDNIRLTSADQLLAPDVLSTAPLDLNRVPLDEPASMSGTASVFARRETVIAAGGYATTAAGIGEYLLTATLLRLAPVYKVGPPSHFYRQHGAMSSRARYNMASSLLGARLFLRLSGSLEIRRELWDSHLLRAWVAERPRLRASSLIDAFAIATLLRAQPAAPKIVLGGLYRRWSVAARTRRGR